MGYYPCYTCMLSILKHEIVSVSQTQHYKIVPCRKCKVNTLWSIKVETGLFLQIVKRKQKPKIVKVTPTTSFPNTCKACCAKKRCAFVKHGVHMFTQKQPHAWITHAEGEADTRTHYVHCALNSKHKRHNKFRTCYALQNSTSLPEYTGCKVYKTAGDQIL